MFQRARAAVSFFRTRLLPLSMPAALACLSVLFAARAPSAEAEAGNFLYESLRQRINRLDTLENPEEQKKGYEEIIARARESDAPEIQRVTARAMRSRAVLEYARENTLEDRGEERVVAKLDEMIAKFEASGDEDIKAEVIAAKLTKANFHRWPSKLDDDAIREELYDDIIASGENSADERVRRMVAQAMFDRQYCFSVSTEEALRGLIDKFGSTSDPSVKELVAKAMNRLAEKVETEAEKNALLEKIVAAYQSEENPEIRSIVAEAKENITEEGSFDADAANSSISSYILEQMTGSALRQAWLCEQPAEKTALYDAIVRKYRHITHEGVQVAVFTALIERSFLDMTGANEDAVARFDEYAAKATDYGTWLFIGQNRLWFVRGRANILAALDSLLDPGRKSGFDSGQERYFRDASIDSEKIASILNWAKRLRTDLSAGGRSGAQARRRTGATMPEGDRAEARRLLSRILRECGDAPERLVQHRLSRALRTEAALLDEGDRRNAFWRCVVDAFKPGKSVYARHHVVAGYAGLIAAADGEEKGILMDELAELLENGGTFRELASLEEIRAGKADLPMPLLFRDW